MPDTLVTLPLSSIIDIEDIPDRALNSAHVSTLVATNEPDKWPAIIVTPIGKKYGRIAGKHRIAAAKELQQTAIKAIIRTYTSHLDMYADMWEDNARNGLPLTAKERKAYAVNLHTLLPSLSLRELGRRAGISYHTVKTAIEDAQAQTTEQEEDADIRKLFSNSARITRACNSFRALTDGLNVEDSAALLAETYDDGELEEIEAMLTDMSLIFSKALKNVQQRQRAVRRGA